MNRNLREGIIDKKIRIIKAKNKTLENIEGKVIDESKNMIIIETTQGIKKLIKNQIMLKNEK